MKKPFLLLSLLTVIFFSCEKETATELPPATQTGAHTFGARLNGEIWMPSGFGPFGASNALEARYVSSTGVIYINARNFSKSPVETEFEIVLAGVTGPGVYPLPGTSGSYGYYVKRNITPLNEWSTNSQYTGSVTLTKLDTAGRILSGTFQFNAINQYNTPEPISVTEGRFDIKLP